MSEKYLTITQAAKLAKVTRPTIYSWIKAKKLTVQEIAGIRFISQKELKTAMKAKKKV